MTRALAERLRAVARKLPAFADTAWAHPLIDELQAIAAELDRDPPELVKAREEPVARAWEALGELTSYLFESDHYVKVDDVRAVMERHAASWVKAAAEAKRHG